MKHRRSKHIQLVMLGTVVLGGCSDADLPKDRYAYKARPECVQDWGETNCERAPSGGSSGYFYGPRFNSIVGMPDGRHIWSGNADMPAIHPRTGQPMQGAANVARGGFGRSGGSFASSGS
jgi:uncharacterized protein YgiB involved in biofilm formation